MPPPNLRLSKASAFPVTSYLNCVSIPKKHALNPRLAQDFQQRCRYWSRPSAKWDSAGSPSDITFRSPRNVIFRHVNDTRSRARYSSGSDPQQPLPPASKDGSPRELPSQSEHRRSPLSKRASHLMDNLQSNVFIAGQRLNDLTGYSGIEALKQDIEKSQVATTRTTLQNAKDDYTTSISQRSASQREVNELLQRKHAWSPSDLERFTALYRSDHANEVAESTAQANLMAAERAAEEAANQLSGSILKRYHEEQIWSDKIRRMSTWGTWGLMGVNVLLFLVFQWALEPWRRRRLVRGFEEKVQAVLESEKEKDRATALASEAVPAVGFQGRALEDLQTESIVGEGVARSPGSLVDGTSATPIPSVEAVEAAEASIPDTTADLAATETFGPPDLSFSRPLESLSALLASSAFAFQRLFHTNRVSIRQVDLTSARIEGAVAGIAFASIIAALVRAAR